MPDRFVTIGRFSMLVEAQAVKNKLAEFDIPTSVIDDSIGGSLPGLNDSVGGITVQVREDDFDRAEKILASFLGDSKEDDFLDDSQGWICTACDTPVKGDSLTCPVCGAAKDALQAQPSTAIQSVGPPELKGIEDEDDEPATRLENSAAEVVKADSTRGVTVGLLLTPFVIFFIAAALILLATLIGFVAKR